ncbi:HEAT repeat domain-containing protein [Chloroflexi bacterium TSY]|nr:HEAT repeat domain-containing protein [Chloroflexi bacterium TSY]
MVPQEYLLTDEQMQRFIAHGYLILKADFPDYFHETLRTQIETIVDKEGNPGNNILPRVPEVRTVFEHPTIRGALTSVLGPNYIMHPHRHCHFSRPGRTTQQWHKDSYWGFQKVRNHHNWWAMIFYYPQNTVEEMGPSAILPGTQYYAKRVQTMEEELHLTGTAGTFALIHYDLWHKGTENVSDRNRSMMKFQFVRLDAPSTPTWNHQESTWRPLNGSAPPTTQETLWQHQWKWHLGENGEASGSGHGARSSISHGNISDLVQALQSDQIAERLAAVDALGQAGEAAGEAIPMLIDALRDRAEPVAVAASYALAAMGDAALPSLLNTLKTTNKSATRNAGYALSAMGASTVPGLIDALSVENDLTKGYAAFALGEAGSAALEAVPTLAQVAPSQSDWVRRHVVEALGTIGGESGQAVATLASALQDPDDQVRFTAGLSLTRLGEQAETAVPALKQALDDENRYVRANAVDALRQIGTKGATNVLLDYLMASRWCSTTTPENLF